MADAFQIEQMSCVIACFMCAAEPGLLGVNCNQSGTWPGAALLNI
jgi:hypothetical protein